jgi:hypothetical protein
VADADRKFLQLKLDLQKQLREEISVHWRKDKLMPLPYFVQRQVKKWLHKDPLPQALQLLSRPFKRMRVFDEKLLVKMKLNSAKRKCVRAKRKLKRAAHCQAAALLADRKSRAITARAKVSGDFLGASQHQDQRPEAVASAVF